MMFDIEIPIIFREERSTVWLMQGERLVSSSLSSSDLICILTDSQHSIPPLTPNTDCDWRAHPDLVLQALMFNKL